MASEYQEAMDKFDRSWPQSHDIVKLHIEKLEQKLRESGGLCIPTDVTGNVIDDGPTVREPQRCDECQSILHVDAFRVLFCANGACGVFNVDQPEVEASGDEGVRFLQETGIMPPDDNRPDHIHTMVHRKRAWANWLAAHNKL